MASSKNYPNKQLNTKYRYENMTVFKISDIMYSMCYSNIISGYSVEVLLSKCKIRKNMLCASTGIDLKGKFAYRPITNGYIRGLRIDATIVESLFSDGNMTTEDNITIGKLSNLAEGDYIAFGFNYNGGTPTEIIVSNISSVYDDKVLVHFLYGHHSLGEFIDKKDIIAIGNMNYAGKINGWSGKFDILLPNHPLLKE